MKSSLLKKLILLSIIVFYSFITRGEGSKDLESESGTKTKLVIGTDRISNYATYTSDPEHRIYIHISNTSEKIYLGFGKAFQDNEGEDIINNLYYRIKDGLGNTIRAGTPVPKSGKGYISNQSTSIGPQGLSGFASGYDPIIIDALMTTGDYYIEFSRTNTDIFSELKLGSLGNRVIFDHFDITVGEGNTAKPGRLWSHIWSLTTLSLSAETRSKLYIYTPDSVVSRVSLNGMQANGFAVMSNKLGTNSSTIFEESRKSSASSFTAYPEYKLFLNDPDHLAFPSHKIFRSVSSVSLNGCTERGYCIGVKLLANKSMEAEILLDFNSNGLQDPEDRILNHTVEAGWSCIPWDGKNALGGKLPFGSKITIIVKVLSGVANFLIYDGEYNYNGLIVEVIRPQVKMEGLLDNLAPRPLNVFWDDSKIDVNKTSALKSCIADGTNDCRIWGSTAANSYDGNNNTLNTWWHTFEYGFHGLVSYDPMPEVDAGPPQKVCSDLMTEGVKLGIQPSNNTFSTDNILWRVTKGAPSFEGDSPFILQPTVTLNNAIDDTVFYEVIVERNGCSFKDSTFVYKAINKGPSLTGLVSVCPGVGKVYYVAKDPLSKSFKWEVVNGIITNNFTDSIEVTWNNTPGVIGRVKVTADFQDCAIASTILDVKIEYTRDELKAPIAVGDTIVCQNSYNVHTYEVPFSPNYRYFWNVENGRFKSSPVINNGMGLNKMSFLFPFPDESAKVYVTVSSEAGNCIFRSESILKVRIKPRPSMAHNQFDVCSNSTLEISPLGSSNGLSYQWTPTYGLSSYNVARPSLNMLNIVKPDTIKYAVTATNSFNCSSTDTVQVNIYPKPTKIELVGDNYLCKERLRFNPPLTYTLKTKYAERVEWRVFDRSTGRPATNVNIDPNTNSVTVQWDTLLSVNTLSYTLRSDQFPNNNQCVTRGSIDVSFKNYITFKPFGEDIICNYPGIGHYKVYSNGGSVYNWYAENGIISQTSPDSVAVQWDLTKLSTNRPYKLWVYQTNAEDEECKVEKEEFKLNVKLFEDCITLRTPTLLEAHIGLSPNPSKGTFQIIQTNAADLIVSATNILGQDEALYYDSNKGEAILSNATPGIYNILIKRGQEYISKRILISE